MLKELGWIRVAGAVPLVAVGAVSENVAAMVAMAREADAHQCDLIVFPELGTTAYTCSELFQQRTLLEAAEKGLETFLEETSDLNAVSVLGLPVALNGQLFNCAAAVCRGQILGVVPKTYIPGYNEYYEPRWFTTGDAAPIGEITLCSQTVPFGIDLIFREDGNPRFCFGIEICEDLWAPIPPSSRLALAGATIIANPSASNDLVGKSAYRRDLIKQQSGRCLAGYVYASAGVGESSTDLVFGGHILIAENGTMLAENERFGREASMTMVDLDVEFLDQQRLQQVTFSHCIAKEYIAGDLDGREVSFGRERQPTETVLRRIDPRPFVPAAASDRAARCREIFALQSSGLATRLSHVGVSDVVIGLSGGLDSTLALLVVVEAFSRLGLDKGGIHCITMPGFGTTDRTRGNAEELCGALGLELETIDITASCIQHMKDIGHDGRTHDITFENTQARERTQILMNRSNMLNALVIGTGDLSELALGWCTYNGDHMSMYAVNNGVPKTLVQFLIDYVIDYWHDDTVTAVLRDILDTPISPELLPPDESGEIRQKTEEVIGPYVLHDFFLYQVVRCGFPPEKILKLAELAFENDYSRDEIKMWLAYFYRRFFSQQFKRSCLPDGPKIGSVSLSPRGDWRMPSDARVDEWLARLEPC